MRSSSTRESWNIHHVTFTVSARLTNKQRNVAMTFAILVGLKALPPKKQQQQQKQANKYDEYIFNLP